MCRIAILENYSLFCSGIRPVLEKVDSFNIIAERKHISDFLPDLRQLNLDLIIMDVIHCEYDGIVPIKRIRRKSSKVPILLIVNKEYSAYFEDYISLGVNGLIFNDSGPEELVLAVNQIVKGDDYFPQMVWLLLKSYLRTKKKDNRTDKETNNQLTSREMAVLKLFCKGYTYKEIGNTLNISPRTVETHKKNILGKVNVRSTAEMVEFAIQNDFN